MESKLSSPREDSANKGNVGVNLHHWATLDPGNTAFVCYGANGKRETITKSDVLKKALCFASYLKESGIKKGDGVVIYMARSIDAIIAFYGACCVGGVCYMFNDVSDCGDVMQLLHDKDDVKVLCIDCSSSEDGSSLVETVLQSKNEPALKAIVINGEVRSDPSTTLIASMSDILDDKKHDEVLAGNANCCDNDGDVVFFVHKNCNNECFYVGCPRNALFGASADVVKRLAVNRGSVIFSDQNFAHALSAARSYLASGCMQVFLEESLKKQTKYLEFVSKIITKEGCTDVFLSPQLLDQMVQHDSVPPMPTVQSLICPGESRVPESYRRLLGTICRTLTILYEYQWTIPVSMTTVTDPALLTDGIVGQPLPGITMKVINDEGEIAARGTEGSLEIQTGYRVYEKRGTSKQEDWIRTGYKARIRSDDNIVLTGHDSELVTLGTKRFFTHQVENVISKCPGVLSVVVLLLQNSRLRSVLCACLIADEEFDMDFLETFCDGIWSTANALAKSCRRPSFFILFNEFPRTSEGVVDKTKLSQDVRAKLWPEPQAPVQFF